jgi:hypothetical protein
MLFCCLDVEFDMSTSNELSSSSKGIFEANNILGNIHLHCHSFCKLDWGDIGALDDFGSDCVEITSCSGGIMGCCCGILGRDSTTSYIFSN